MPLTVAHVIALPELRLIVRTRTAPLDREVRWVAVSEHVDPTPWLAADDLLLTTGMALDLTPAAARAYVGRLGAAGVAGLGFGTGLTHQEVPPGRVEADAAADALGVAHGETDVAAAFIGATALKAAIAA